MSDDLSSLTVMELLLAYRRIKFEPHNRGVEKLNAYVAEAQRRDARIEQLIRRNESLDTMCHDLEAQVAELERMVSLEMNQAIEIGNLRRRVEALGAERYEPVPDGRYEAQHGKDHFAIDGEWLTAYEDNWQGKSAANIALPDGYALCRLVAGQEGQGEAVSLEAILQEVVEWQRMQFPHRSAASIAKHLLEEAQELQREPTSEMEMADVLLLLVALADFNAVNLAEVARCKLAINKARVWGEPDEHGVVKHVDTPAPASPQAE